MQLVRLGEYSLEQVGLDDGVLDGPFLMGSGQFGLLVSLRGKDGGGMPERGEIHWLRDLPAAASGAPLQVFLRRGASVLSLGSDRTASLASRFRTATPSTCGLARRTAHDWNQSKTWLRIGRTSPSDERGPEHRSPLRGPLQAGRFKAHPLLSSRLDAPWDCYLLPAASVARSRLTRGPRRIVLSPNCER